MPLNNPRPCKDASLFMDEIQRGVKTVFRSFDKHQADWLLVQNQGLKNPHNFEVDDVLWLRKSETTLDGDDKLLPLWGGPFAVTAYLGENRWKIRVDVKGKLKFLATASREKLLPPKGELSLFLDLEIFFASDHRRGELQTQEESRGTA